MDTEVLKLEIAKLSLGPDDVLVLRHDPTDASGSQELQDCCADLHAEMGIRSVLMPKSIDLAVVSQARAARRPILFPHLTGAQLEAAVEAAEKAISEGTLRVPTVAESDWMWPRTDIVAQIEAAKDVALNGYPADRQPIGIALADNVELPDGTFSTIPVKLCLGGPTIGTADLRQEDGKVLADIEIDESWRDRPSLL